ncbi:MAG: S41 family peptidase [Ardenticatenaceae bacterium]|nr:S41 family peptidase [Ardenticatenaceae bacterium]
MTNRVYQAVVGVIVVALLMLGSCVAGMGVTVAAAPALARAGIGAPLGVSSGAPSPEVARIFRPFWEAWNLVTEHYVDPAAADPQRMTYGAIRGMLDTLGDVGHTRFLSPEDRKLEETSLAGQFAGIGAEVDKRDDRIVVVAPLEGSPAEAAGIVAGDVIVKIDGEPTEGMSLTEAVTKVRGEPGTKVTLTVIHPNQTELSDITITRQEIQIPAASWTMLPGNVAYIRLNQFSANLHDELVPFLKAAQQQGAERYLVDVRNNPGGLVDQVVAVTSEFLPEGIVFIQQSRSGARQEFRVTGNALVPSAPMVVLTNEGSASAAEIFAGALKDQGRATLVGETTFGTGTVLNTYNLSDGSALLLGVAEWLTPSGHLIKGNGVEPDVKVALPAEVQPVSPSRVKGQSQAQLEALPDTQFVEGYKRVLGK